MRALVAIALTFGPAACDDETSYLALVELSGLHVHLMAPTDVQSGEKFTITVRTPSGGCNHPDYELVVTEGPDIVIVPYDVFVDPGSNGACTSDLRYNDHVVTLRYDSAGTKTIRVRAQRGRDLTPTEPGEVIDTLFTIEVN